MMGEKTRFNSPGNAGKENRFPCPCFFSIKSFLSVDAGAAGFGGNLLFF